MIPPNLVSHLRHVLHLGNGVHPYDVSAGEDRRRDRGGRCPIARRRWNASTKRPFQKGFPGRPYNERASQVAELVEASERFKAMRRLLRKPQAGIDQDSIVRNAGTCGEREALAEL